MNGNYKIYTITANILPLDNRMLKPDSFYSPSTNSANNLSGYEIKLRNTIYLSDFNQGFISCIQFI